MYEKSGQIKPSQGAYLKKKWKKTVKFANVHNKWYIFRLTHVIQTEKRQNTQLLQEINKNQINCIETLQTSDEGNTYAHSHSISQITALKMHFITKALNHSCLFDFAAACTWNVTVNVVLLHIVQLTRIMSSQNKRTSFSCSAC